uniref:Elevenin receptor 2 n=1 Tax=Platynereis dumerilii TaxID=6359 RepID=A0A0K0PUH9_PLADU|nr:elevenin receptor 2 [Platynereis dumerilii]
MDDLDNDTLTSNSSNLTLDDYYDDVDEYDSYMLEVTFVSLFYSLTLLLGLIGNLLVISSILRFRSMRTVTNAFLTSLATADLLLIAFCVPIKFAKWFSYTWTFEKFLCKAVHYLQNVTVFCSVLTLTFMSIERYYAILHPMRTLGRSVKRACVVCLIIWAVSFVLAGPNLYIQDHKPVGGGFHFWCVDRCYDCGQEIIYKIYAVYMLLLVLVAPLIIMSFAYISICKELWSLMSTRRQMRCGVSGTDAERETCVRASNSVRDKTSDDSTKEVIKMLVAVILLFAICWGPTLVDSVLANFHLIDKFNYDYVKHMRQAFALMSYFNSCVNPIVYAFMSRNFRKTFKATICTCVYRKRNAERFMNSHQCTRLTSQTRDTSFSMTRTISIKNDMETEASDLRYEGDAYRFIHKDEPL